MRAPLVRLLFATAAALLAACAESPADPIPSPLLDIIPDRATYAAGDLVTVTIHNRSAQRMTYTMCAGSVLQRRSGGGWRKPASGPLTTCDAAVLYLDAGAFVETEYPLPETAFAGTYRIFYPGIVAPGDANQVEDHSSSRPFAVTFSM